MADQNIPVTRLESLAQLGPARDLLHGELARALRHIVAKDLETMPPQEYQAFTAAIANLTTATINFDGLVTRAREIAVRGERP